MKNLIIGLICGTLLWGICHASTAGYTKLTCEGRIYQGMAAKLVFSCYPE